MKSDFLAELWLSGLFGKYFSVAGLVAVTADVLYYIYIRCIIYYIDVLYIIYFFYMDTHTQFVYIYFYIYIYIYIYKIRKLLALHGAEKKKPTAKLPQMLQGEVETLNFYSL